MPNIPSLILDYATSLPEAAPICPSALLHLGSRAGVDQALSRLARSEQLMRICRGVYMRPITTRFGSCSPSLEKAISSLSALWGETIVPSGGAAANVLGLSNQNPVQPVFLTSGSTRILHFHRLRVRLRHAPPWQLVVPDRQAGAVIRALAS